MFWFWVIFLAILFLGIEGILGVLGICLAFIVLFIAYGLLTEYLGDHPEKKEKFMKGLVYFIIIAVVGGIGWYVTCNVICNRYQLEYTLEREQYWPDYDKTVGHIESYEKYYIALSDSDAIAKSRSYVIDEASDLANSDSNIIGVNVRYIRLINLNVNRYNNIEPYGIIEQLKRAIRAEIPFFVPKKKPTEP